MNTEISMELYELLNGKDLETKQHEAMMLQTVTEDMWPHTAMVSVGEVIALGRGDLRLALWPGTTTTQNMIRTGRALLVVIFSGKVYYVRLSLQRLPELTGARHPRERFFATVTAVRQDTAKYADIVSGVQINLKESTSVLERWKETLEELTQE
ncbi:pyridoxamine 5'-phosphate oxidase family protein [Aneurinibacillus sp. Ricciae_BoGa-3]|uniref:pyridoxamine 5'-phosphate oxidase family protein n=1 Tax=Aneurinibacillus sp. Ricciae_BoGa-3 TaxID=3022697 RepID=UPI0023406390|nr:pyridoxamine 5'-phosphate oxidase family protein [Aneurinibacillus sp. Ricciae_BoGa-3]WCK54913.1 pyridoxamine 5'-phosphate oxidase family protein [Aneurinibacillus sp. Ricciae_BoGa-3]